MRKLTVLLTLITGCAAFYSCGVEGCDELMSVNAGVTFVNKQTQPIALTEVTVSGIGAPNDSILYNAVKNVKSVDLPLRITSEKTSYVFKFKATNPDTQEDVYINDTLHINYTNLNHFISEDCGCLVYHTLKSLEYTKHLLDSAYIYQPEITNKYVQNILLKF